MRTRQWRLLASGSWSQYYYNTSHVTISVYQGEHEHVPLAPFWGIGRIVGPWPQSSRCLLPLLSSAPESLPAQEPANNNDMNEKQYSNNSLSPGLFFRPVLINTKTKVKWVRLSTHQCYLYRSGITCEVTAGVLDSVDMSQTCSLSVEMAGLLRLCVLTACLFRRYVLDLCFV